MEANYRRLDYKKRVAIYYLRKQGCSQREISRQLEVSPSTISREIKRNQTGKHYFPEVAQRKTKARGFKQTRKMDVTPALKRVVFRALRKQRIKPGQRAIFSNI